MKSKKKPFLRHPRFRPLAHSFFAFIATSLIAGTVIYIEHINLLTTKLHISLTIICVLLMIYSAFSATKFYWREYFKGGWKQDQNKYMESIESKQPWEQ